MEFKIDERFVVIQSLKAIVGYLIGVCFVLYFIRLDEPLPFVVGSLFGCVALYFITVFPRKIMVVGGTLSFMNKYGLKRKIITLEDIKDVHIDSGLYKTMTVMTKSGKRIVIHPRDCRKLEKVLLNKPLENE